MSDSFDENGLQVASVTELRQSLESSFKEIYGDDISVESNTPDGQLINILAQKGVDVRGLLMQLYNSFNPDNAQGAVLDQRCAINNIFRKAGTFTSVAIDITTDRTVTLQGLDSEYNSLDATGYTVQDNEGNRFILANTITLAAGTTRVAFRAEQLGEVLVMPNTITTPVTVVLGVVSVNNLTVATAVGTDEEKDSSLRERRRQSVALSSFAYLDGLQAALLQLDGVVDAKVYENPTNSIDSDGIPAHGIWVVMEGGSSKDIATTVYNRKTPGTNMKGSLSYTITTPAGTPFVAKWDEADTLTLYIKFNIQPITPSVTFDLDAIKEYIETNLSYKIGQDAETASITEIAQEAINAAGGNGYAVDVQISDDNATWVEYLSGVTAKIYAVADVNITEL